MTSEGIILRDAKLGAVPAIETFLARSVRGLEWLAAAEIETDLNGEIVEVGHREIIFSAPHDSKVSQLGSIDDLFLVCGKIDAIDRTRASLARLAEGLRKLPLVRFLAKVEKHRPVRRASGFEVVGSFLGRRNYNRKEIETSAGEAIAGIVGMPFLDHDLIEPGGVDVSFRIHLRDTEAIVGLRVTSRPLHRRPYRTASIPGALHPPVAFAMAMLSGAKPGHAVTDPCCGTGTLLIEAKRLLPDAAAVGSDLSEVSLQAARSNGINAGYELRLARADLGRLPYRDGSAGCVLANLPWGQAVQPEGIVRDDIGLAISEILRILGASGNAVLLMPPADEMLDKRCRTLWSIPIRVAGRWTTIYVVAGNKGAGKRPVCLETRYGPSLQRMWDRFGDIAVVGAPVDGAV
jgi:tRNA (guanine6-N2)-methyltransferase